MLGRFPVQRLTLPVHIHRRWRVFCPGMEIDAPMGLMLFHKLKALRANVSRAARRLRPSQSVRQHENWQPAGGPVLVIAPHPDDEVIGCGGTAARHVQSGDPVSFVILTRGAQSVGYPWLTPEQRMQVREGESRASALRLGVRDIAFVDGEDGHMSEPAVGARVLTQLAEIFARTRPKRIYVPHPNDGHPDHAAAYELAQRLLAQHDGPRPEVFQYEVWRPLEANCAVDITDLMKLKLKAIRCHRLALDAFNYVNTLQGLATYRSGTMLGRQGYAEAFHRESESSAFIQAIGK